MTKTTKEEHWVDVRIRTPFKKTIIEVNLLEATKEHNIYSVKLRKPYAREK